MIKRVILVLLIVVTFPALFARLVLAQEPGSELGEISHQLSPDGQWAAIVNRTAGSLELFDQRQSRPIFAAGSGVTGVEWSPGSRRLLVVRSYNVVTPELSQADNNRPLEIWQVRLEDRRVLSPTLLFRADAAIFNPESPQQLIFGHWSPDSRYVVMWVGMLSASILADGLPPLVLDTATGETYSVAVSTSPEGLMPQAWPSHVALTNPRYHSWAPDSSKLAITVGGYRSAQVGKWLNLFEPGTGRVTTVISEIEQVPGIVVWSPRGDLIAYAAVPADQTGSEWADWMTFDNPAIAGRRVYLLDPDTGQSRRLNEIKTYQDAPVWSNDGLHLYYVQRNGDHLQLMVADPETGRAEPVPGARQPVKLKDLMRPAAGYYGQFGREELLEQIPEPAVGATATGRVIEGYGRHQPVGDLPLWVGNEPGEEIKRRTAEDGAFSLTGLRPGLIRVRNSHLEFDVPVSTLTDTVTLGLLKYPLIHPPSYYWWTAAPLPDPSLLSQGQEIPFIVCYTAPDWQRPTTEEQQAAVWSKRPFSERAKAWLAWWFERPAVLYTSEDQFEQSYPDGPNLDPLTADWRYLLGLWTDTNLPFEPEFPDIGLAVPVTDCPYDGPALADLLSRRQLEVWLLGYRAARVQQLDQEAAGYEETDLCNPQEIECVERPGHHYAVHVSPAPGYQIIRFAGVEDVLAIHLLDEQNQELSTLPEIQPARWPHKNWTDLPYEVCFSSARWRRPSSEALERFATGDPRYTIETIKSSPLWTRDFLTYSGGANGQALLFNLGGFWSAAGDITRKQASLCQQREREVSTGRQIEVWLKNHRLLQLQYSAGQVRFVVQPENRGFQAIDLLRPERGPLQFIFVTPDGQEITRFGYEG